MNPTELAQKQVQLIHPEKLYNYLPNLSDQTLGALFGLSEVDYRATKAQFAEQIQGVVDELLTDPNRLDQAYRLPFKTNEVVLALGESHTDDALSWFNILQALVERISPEKNIRFLNMAVSGHTTTAALRQFTSQLLQKPTWIFCMLGVNDSLRIGTNPGKTVVSQSETERNLVFMRQLAAQANVAHWIWLTPTPIIEAAQRNNHWFRQMQLSWCQADTQAVSEFLRRQPELLIDLEHDFANVEELDDYFVEDGVHPSLKGHHRIVRAVLDTLTSH